MVVTAPDLWEGGGQEELLSKESSSCPISVYLFQAGPDDSVSAVDARLSRA